MVPGGLAECASQFGRRTKRLKAFHGVRDQRRSLFDAGRVPVDVTEPTFPLAERTLVPEFEQERKGLVAGCDCRVDVFDVQARARIRLQDAEPIIRGHSVDVLDDAFVEGCGLLVRSEEDALVSRKGCELDDGVAITGTECVVGPMNDVVGVVEGVQRPAMQVAAPQGCQRLLDRFASEIVAEAQFCSVADEQTRGDALVDRGRVTVTHRRDQLGGGVAAEHRGGIETVPRRPAETGRASEDGVADRRREPRVLTRENLDDEERIPARPGVKRRRVDASPIDQRCDGPNTQRWQ